ncbi:MAG: hypothetical protein ACRCW6_01990 [Mycoplasmoidaceae bacterium]
MAKRYAIAKIRDAIGSINNDFYLKSMAILLSKPIEIDWLELVTKNIYFLEIEIEEEKESQNSYIKEKNN